MGIFGNRKTNVRKLEAHRDVDGLIRALGDAELSVRCDAATALGNIRDVSAVEPLASALHDDESAVVRMEAATALGRIGDPRAIEPLVAALTRDSDDYVWTTAATALGDMGDPRALPPLIAMLQDAHLAESRVAYAAIALALIGDPRAALPLQAVLNGDARIAQLIACDPQAMKGLEKMGVSGGHA